MAGLVLWDALASDDLIVKFSPVRLFHYEEELSFRLVYVKELDKMGVSDFFKDDYLPCDSVIVFLGEYLRFFKDLDCDGFLGD